MADTFRYRGTLSFVDLDSNWQEIYYVESTDADTALTLMQPVATARSQMLGAGSDVQIDGVKIERVIEDQPPQEESEDQVVYTTSTYFKIAPMDVPWTGIYSTWVATGGQKRQQLLRGIPLSVQPEIWNTPPIDAKWTDAWTVWKTLLIGTQFRMRVRNKTSPLVFIQSILPDTDGEPIITSPAHGLVTGQLVTFFRVKAAFLTIRGVKRVIVLDANRFKILGYNVASIGFLRGSYRPTVYVYSAISNVFLGRSGERPVNALGGRVRGKRPQGKH